jgi:hypothetical protein
MRVLRPRQQGFHGRLIAGVSKRENFWPERPDCNIPQAIAVQNCCIQGRKRPLFRGSGLVIRYTGREFDLMSAPVSQANLSYSQGFW